MRGMWTHRAVAQHVERGDGVIGSLKELTRRFGMRQVMLVTSAARLAEHGAAVEKVLGRALCSTFDGAEPHTPGSVVQAAVMQARRDGVDSLVTLGGGSTIDLGKAIVFFSEQEAGTPGLSVADRPVLPHIAVPTTLVGAAATPTFAMTDPGTRQKAIASAPTIAPLGVLYDDAILDTTPPDLLLATAADALAHSIETICSPARSAEAEALASVCAGQLVEALGSYAADHGDTDAWSALVDAAALAARAGQNAERGAHHGLVNLLSARVGASHSAVSNRLLVPLLEFNADLLFDELALLQQALGTDDPVGSVRELMSRVGLDGPLDELGVGEEDIEAVARQSTGNPAIRANPRPVGEGDVRLLLEAALGGAT